MDLQWYVKSKHASYPVGKATNLHIIIKPAIIWTFQYYLLSHSCHPLFCHPTSGCHTKLLLFHNKYRPYHDSLEVNLLSSLSNKSHTRFFRRFLSFLPRKLVSLASLEIRIPRVCFGLNVFLVLQMMEKTTDGKRVV